MLPSIKPRQAMLLLLVMLHTLPLHTGQWLLPSADRNSVSPTIMAPAHTGAAAQRHRIQSSCKNVSSLAATAATTAHGQTVQTQPWGRQVQGTCTADTLCRCCLMSIILSDDNSFPDLSHGTKRTPPPRSLHNSHTSPACHGPAAAKHQQQNSVAQTLEARCRHQMRAVQPNTVGRRERNLPPVAHCPAQPTKLTCRTAACVAQALDMYSKHACTLLVFRSLSVHMRTPLTRPIFHTMSRRSATLFQASGDLNLDSSSARSESRSSSASKLLLAALEARATVAVLLLLLCEHHQLCRRGCCRSLEDVVEVGCDGGGTGGSTTTLRVCGVCMKASEQENQGCTSMLSASLAEKRGSMLHAGACVLAAVARWGAGWITPS